MILPPPKNTEWSGCQALQAGSTWRITAIRVAAVLTLENMAPGHKINVTTTVTPTGSAPAVLTIEDEAFPLQPGVRRYIAATVTAGDTLEMTLAGCVAASFENLTFEDLTPTSANPLPAEVLSLQAFFPYVGIDGLRLDRSRWDRASFTRGRAPRGVLEFNRDAWDTRRFYSEEQTTGWQDITQPVTSMSLSRGVGATGPVMAAQVGTLTINAVDGLDPRALGLGYGTPIRLIHWPSRTPLFAGVLTNQQITHARPRSRHDYTVALTACDEVARLASITRYGARAETKDGSEAWSKRLERLLKSSPETRYVADSTSHALMCATVWETKLANHLDALCASVGGAWWVDRENIVHFTTRRPPAWPEILFTDAADTDPYANTWSYSGADLSWDAGETIAHITATNHGARIEEGQWQADDRTVTVSSPTASEVWRGIDAKIDTTLVTGVEDAARNLIRGATENPTPKTLTLYAAHPNGPKERGEHMRAFASLDPLTSAYTTSRGEHYPTVITRITHTLTPKTWKTTLTLIPNR